MSSSSVAFSFQGFVYGFVVDTIASFGEMFSSFHLGPYMFSWNWTSYFANFVEWNPMMRLVWIWLLHERESLFPTLSLGLVDTDFSVLILEQELSQFWTCFLLSIITVASIPNIYSLTSLKPYFLRCVSSTATFMAHVVSGPSYGFLLHFCHLEVSVPTSKTCFSVCFLFVLFCFNEGKRSVLPACLCFWSRDGNSSHICSLPKRSECCQYVSCITSLTSSTYTSCEVSGIFSILQIRWWFQRVNYSP